MVCALRMQMIVGALDLQSDASGVISRDEEAGYPDEQSVQRPSVPEYPDSRLARAGHHVRCVGGIAHDRQQDQCLP
jgi:hypothetical protein